MSSKLKLSPQESNVFNTLTKIRPLAASVFHLYCKAKGLSGKDVTAATVVSHRRMQQHVGVLIARINKKQRKFVAKPGESERTYVLRRR